MSTIQEYRNPILIGVAGVLVAILLYAFVYSPQTSKLSSLQSQETSLTSNQAQLQSQLAILQSEKQKLPANCADLTKINTQIPSVQTPGELAAEQSSFYDQLTQLVSTSGTAIPSFSWQTTTTTPSASSSAAATPTTNGVVPVPVTMSIVGNYGQMSAFVSGLDSFPRLFTIQTFTLSLSSPTSAATTPTTPAASGSGTPSAGPLWVGQVPTAATNGPYSLAIAGSIYYTTTPSATEACLQATSGNS